MAQSGLLIIIGLLTALGAGIVCGFFLTFSASGMRGLDALGPAAATRAMNSINVAVVRPPLMLALFGTGLLGIVLIIVALITSSGTATWLLIIGALIYVIGNPVLTMGYHVPRNNALATTDPDSPEVGEEWSRYYREWTAGNHVRTLAAGVATVLIILGLIAL
jgi:uncharacterized membrane protein